MTELCEALLRGRFFDSLKARFLQEPRLVFSSPPPGAQQPQHRAGQGREHPSQPHPCQGQSVQEAKGQPRIPQGEQHAEHPP